MEVADQWQREWAGTAEYGKVTEGGVTRRIARAMEVLHASAPGARVRVMRAAYHSTAGPGAPAASFMLHSSRRVISSGFNLLESPTNPTRPLEISSMPLESSPESLTENYKVTEPDDLDISEPSKWRSSKASSFRMPSEESSSTDNASIIDLDPRGSRNLHRKYSYDSESSDVQFGRRSSSRASPLLDTPVTLSSLKYKSLLIGSNEWNSRRKSYSFEDTSPLNETILQSNDTLAMESSTDSGICKSSEIVNEHIDENTHMKILTPNERRVNNNDESFQDWLSRNRSNSHHKTTKFKNYREHNIVLEEPIENNITVKATGKVSITLPVINSSDDDIQQKKTTASEDSDRKVKKVEFCKTELHFAAETGKVNIIATDEKPPPSNDFRKRRSAFVPMQELIDKPITLFGDKINMEEVHILNGNSSNLNAFTGELEETDENTAATKSILKNKIPKPKPYLLGENMAFGLSEDLSSKDHYNKSSVLTAVSLVNRQLEIEKRRDTEVKSVFQQDEDADVVKKPAVRTLNKGPVDDHIANFVRKEKTLQSDTVKKDVNFIKNRFNAIQASPVERRAKTRELRQSDLTYFGIDNVRKRADQEKYNYLENRVTSSDTSIDDIFHSVKLIQQVSNSLCNSEVESDDGPDYQNLPINVKHAPIPTPRSRSKYDDESGNVHKIKVLRPIIEKDYEDIQDVNKSYTRRSKLRRQEETVVNRSLSAPPKCLRNGIENPRRHEDRSICSRKDDASRETVPNAPIRMSRKIAPDDNPIYVNLSLVREKLNKNITDKAIERNNIKAKQNKSQTTANSDVKVEQKTENARSNRPSDRKKSEISSNTTSGDSLRKKTSMSKHSLGRRAEKSEPVQHYDNHKTGSAHKPRDKSHPATESVSENKENRSRATQRRSHKSTSEEAVIGSVTKSKESNHKIKNSNIEHNQTRSSSKDKSSSKRDANIVSQELDSIPERQSTTEKVRSKGSEFHKSNSHRPNKKSEYVINYDDKNGTVSSVTKVRSGVGSPQRKKSKETSKHKTVTLNKIALRK